MSDSFPTTNYGNNAARDEVHESAAALHSSLIPHNKASAALDTEAGKAAFSHLACWSVLEMQDNSLQSKIRCIKVKPKQEIVKK